jgi:hypothetical protein
MIASCNFVRHVVNRAACEDEGRKDDPIDAFRIRY